MVGSLTGAVSSQRVTEEHKGTLSAVGNRAFECKGLRVLDCETDSPSSSDCWSLRSGGSVWKGHRSTDKRYSGDNRLIPPKSSYRRRCLAPRCRLITSWGCSRSQGYGCSPFKEVRELGLERRETVRSLSAVGAGDLRESVPSTSGPEWTYVWWTGCLACGSAGLLCTDVISAESFLAGSPSLDEISLDSRSP